MNELAQRQESLLTELRRIERQRDRDAECEVSNTKCLIDGMRLKGLANHEIHERLAPFTSWRVIDKVYEHLYGHPKPEIGAKNEELDRT